MNHSVRWGIVGPGKIAQRFAQAVQSLPGVHVAAVAGRDTIRARTFAHQCAPSATVFGSAAELAASSAVDAVYIATPHSAHGEAVATCLRAGLPVLCEKPLVPTAAQADPLIALARERGVLLMEAVWTRMLPAWAQVRQWLDSGAIGRVTAVQSEFCFDLPYDPAHRCFNPALAGGTLLDIGIYNLTMSQWVAGAAPQSFDVVGTLAPSGVDRSVSGTLHFAAGLDARFACAFDRNAANAFTITGEGGRIELPHRFWEAQCAVLHREGHPPQTVDAPFRVNGFEYEIEEAMRCIGAGAVESPAIPHTSTLATLRLMDTMRARLGVRYPFE